MRAALYLLAADAEGREELAAFGERLREAVSVKSALEHVRPARVMVSVILSSEEPMLMDSRDTLSRRVGGVAFSNAMWQLSEPRYLTCTLSGHCSRWPS